ncbi:MAG: hypothetical protein HWE39_07995 [Oceanospirillaceae bacterium]|nr:hypothetical protein [Oceanospirillaceae bacterium]
MKLPAPESFSLVWNSAALEGWRSLANEVRQLGDSAGKGDRFQQIAMHLLQISRTMDFRQLPELLRSRVTARALTQLWLENNDFLSRMLNATILRSLVTLQQPMLGIMPLHNLITLYFREFDRLDQHEAGVREALELVIKDQIALRLEQVDLKSERNLLTILYGEAYWLLADDGPKQLVDYVRSERRELSEAFSYFELRGLDNGRYADICRAHYYLETLREIPLGSYDEVFSELLKPSVSKAPYEGEKRIGHAALEILIDRADGDPGESWQSFIMDMAGDPRISSSASNYRQWWKPLGESRVEKVRGWLAKEDLRLFLRALEQYGKESRNSDLQRMFPARKHFLEGLDRLKLVRRTRLMLGSKTEYSVKKILGNELKTSYIKLTNDNAMSDKAVIYIDCGDFCLVEGSHNFKLWVYLAPPSENLYSYDVNKISHYELTSLASASYKKNYGSNAPYSAVTHNPKSWQKTVFEFLADHGIELEIEQLMSSHEYDYYLSRFGMPVVKGSKTVLRKNKKLGSQGEREFAKPVVKPKLGLSDLAVNIVNYFYYNPGGSDKTAAYFLMLPEADVANVIDKELKNFVIRNRDFSCEVKKQYVDQLIDFGVIKND